MDSIFKVDIVGGCLSLRTELPDGAYQVRVKKWRESRTLRQNAYLHVVLSAIADETGYTLHEIKEFFRQMFLSDPVEICNKVVYVGRSTIDTDTEEMNKFIDNIRNYAATNLNMYIPSPDEQLFSKFQNIYA